MIAYLNGKFLATDKCVISPLDRGFLFGDSVYEVLPVYQNIIFRFDDHLRRLDYSLSAVHIDNPYSNEQWKAIFSELISRCGLSDLSVYLQISRGSVPIREHIPTGDMVATVFAMTMPLRTMSAEIAERGVSVVTVDDIRWARCDIKSTCLLPNVMLGMQAKTKDAYEAIIIHEGYVTEGTSSNVFVVHNRGIYTPPLNGKVLAGITRQAVIEIADRLKVTCREKELTRTDLLNADEIWLTSSTRNIVAVTGVDEKQIGQGTAGELWRRFSAALVCLSKSD